MLVETHPDQPVLIVNPTSGGGTASRYDLVGQCRARGIEPIVFERGDDLSALAAAAVEGGADVIGMAGGDGSQAAVAAVAAEHDVPYVCVPAGTRNHIAIDIGVGRDDVVGALDAFVHGAERRIDLARVNDPDRAAGLHAGPGASWSGWAPSPRALRWARVPWPTGPPCSCGM